MRKFTILVGIIAFCFSTTVLSEKTYKELMGFVLNSTVKIVSYHDDGRASGSGVILSDSGLILTNYHVIHNSVNLKVWLYQNREKRYYTARVVSVDPTADLALIDIDPNEDDYFTVADFEFDTDVVHAGVEVIAVGHPLGLPWSVTKGVINSVNRPSFITPYVSLIQHDAVIQHGSSGGPLFNDQGNLIGINTYVLSPKERGVSVYSGMGYAVQSNDVFYSTMNMIENGTSENFRPAMRVTINSLDEDIANILREENKDVEIYIPDTLGLIVTGVEKDDYAYVQGLRNYDVIVALDGFPVNNLYEMSTYIKNNKEPHTEIYLMVLRDREFFILSYMLSSLDVPLDFYNKNEKPPR